VDGRGGSSRLVCRHHRRIITTASAGSVDRTSTGASEVTNSFPLAASVVWWPPSHWRRLARRGRRRWRVSPRPSLRPAPRRIRLRRIGRMHVGGRDRGDQRVVVGRLRLSGSRRPVGVGRLLVDSGSGGCRIVRRHHRRPVGCPNVGGRDRHEQ